MTEAYEPRFDIDRAYGEEGEDTVRNLLGLKAARVEVKRKSRRDLKFYVETAQSPGATGTYKRSGINTTESECWAYTIADTGVVVLVPTALLKQAAKTAEKVEEKDGDNPTKGRLVDFLRLIASLPPIRVVDTDAERIADETITGPPSG